MCCCFINILVSAVSWKAFVSLCPCVLSMALGRRSGAWIQAMMVQNWPGFSSAAHPEPAMIRSFSQFIKKKCTRRINQRKWFWPRSVIGIITRVISRSKLSSLVTVQALCLLSVTNCFCRCSSHLHHQDVERGTTAVRAENHSHNWADVCWFLLLVLSQGLLQYLLLMCCVLGVCSYSVGSNETTCPTCTCTLTLGAQTGDQWYSFQTLSSLECIR